MSCYYDYILQMCVCQQKIENVPVSEFFLFFQGVFNA